MLLLLVLAVFTSCASAEPDIGQVEVQDASWHWSAASPPRLGPVTTTAHPKKLMKSKAEGLEAEKDVGLAPTAGLAPATQNVGLAPTAGLVPAVAANPNVGLVPTQYADVGLVPTKHADVGLVPTAGLVPAESERRLQPVYIRHSLLFNIFKFLADHPIIITMSAFTTIICLMLPGVDGGGRNNSNRYPHEWGPEMESRYPFRRWARHVMIWSIFNSDLDARRKCAAVLSVLRGGAAEWSQALPPQAILTGGIVNGVQADPMTYLMHALSERFAQMGEEARLGSITELMTFTRNGQERIDSLITRFDGIRQRAQDQGMLLISVQGLAWLLLRACGVNDNQLLTLLQPFQGLFPATPDQYQQLCTGLRRMGHIIERSPGNIASQLRGNNNQAHAFFADQPTQQHQQDPWQAGDGSDPWAAAFNQQEPSYPAWGQQHQQQQYWNPAYPTYEDQDSDNGTDTDTVSSCYDTDYQLLSDIPVGASQSLIAQHLYWAYQVAKGHWRRFTGKPVRAVRRFIRRKGKGKGKGNDGSKGKGKASKGKIFLAELPDDQVESVFKGKSKGKGGFKGKRSTGKGKGGHGNPLGPDGRPMECHDCGSTDHLVRQCDRSGPRGNRTGAHLAMTAFPNVVAPQPGVASSNDDDAGPLAGIVDPVATQQVRAVFMMQEVYATTASGQPEGTLTWQTLRRQQYMAHRQAGQVSQSPNVVQVGLESTPGLEPTPWGFESVGTSVPASGMASAPAGATLPTLEPSTAASASPALPRNYTTMPMPDDIANWAMMPEFGFIQNEGLASPATTQMFPGAYGQSVPSTLDRYHHATIDAHAHIESTLQRYQELGQDERVFAAPSVTSRSTLDPVHHHFIDTFQDVQRFIERTREDRRQAIKGKGKDKGKAPFQTDEAETIDFDGDDRTCPICMSEFERDDRCLRLVCRHVYHVHCWNDLLIANDTPIHRCPTCRGGARVIARFRFIPDETRAVGPTLPQMTPAASEESFHSVFPWMPAPGEQPEGYYHSSTQLPDGQLSLMVDIGAWTNIAGSKLGRAMAKAAAAAGHAPHQRRMSQPLSIMGVGNGTQECKWEAQLPICIEGGADDGNQIHRFDTPLVEGTGEDLPAILGLKSIKGKQGVIQTADGKEMLSFPGPGGYEIKWSPGTQHFRLKSAPSGHLVVPLGDFSQTNKSRGGVACQPTVFHATSDVTRMDTGARGSGEDAPLPH